MFSQSSYVMYYPNFQVKIMLYLTVVVRSLTETFKKQRRKNQQLVHKIKGIFDRGCHDTTFFKRNILYGN